jgi:hypothetical protein
MTTRRQSRPTVEVPAVPTHQMLSTPKSYRDESWYTETAKTQEMPAITDTQAEAQP